MRLASIWKGLFGLEKIERESDFFLAAGNSLTALRMVNLIKKDFNIQISIREIFDHRTLAEQARLLDNRLEEAEKRH